jgi:hypothetical protein
MLLAVRAKTALPHWESVPDRDAMLGMVTPAVAAITLRKTDTGFA